VKVIPQGGAATTATSAPLAGTNAASSTSASVNLATGVNVISAIATFALPTTASIEVPTRFAGDSITHIRVAAVYGQPSTVTYITASGREIPASEVGSQSSAISNNRNN
jgi:hypothetical protein